MSDQHADLLDRCGPWAVIAGGSEGIGAAFARSLAAGGFDLVLVARRSGPLEDLAALLRADHGGSVVTVAGDLLDEDTHVRLADATADLEVGLVVVAAGGGHQAAPFLERPRVEERALARLNCEVPVELAGRFLGPMVERGGGGFVLLSAMSSVAGAALSAVPGGAKAFVVAFAEGLWAEVAPRGVDVLCLIPGVTDTPALRRAGSVVGSDLLPGLDPAEVAHEGLLHLGEGPVWVAGDTTRDVHAFLASLPRREAATYLEVGARRIFGLEPMEEA
jgi:short-subunit dehydrogenase